MYLIVSRNYWVRVLADIFVENELFRGPSQVIQFNEITPWDWQRIIFPISFYVTIVVLLSFVLRFTCLKLTQHLPVTLRPTNHHERYVCHCRYKCVTAPYRYTVDYFQVLTLFYLFALLRSPFFATMRANEKSTDVTVAVSSSRHGRQR